MSGQHAAVSGELHADRGRHLRDVQQAKRRAGLHRLTAAPLDSSTSPGFRISTVFICFVLFILRCDIYYYNCITLTLIDFFLYIIAKIILIKELHDYCMLQQRIVLDFKFL